MSHCVPPRCAASPRVATLEHHQSHQHHGEPGAAPCACALGNSSNPGTSCPNSWATRGDHRTYAAKLRLTHHLVGACSCVKMLDRSRFQASMDSANGGAPDATTPAVDRSPAAQRLPRHPEP